jgi:hypothetical protein
MKNNQEQNKQYIDYLRNFGYMQGVDRSNRVKSTQEIFTPIAACEYYCTTLSDYSNAFTDVTEKIVDNCSGDGEWLGACLIKRLENGFSLEESLLTLLGSDLQEDNINLCRRRLLCGREDLRHIVEQTIVCADALRYHYRFDGSHPYDDETKAKAEEDHLNNLFSFE